LFFHNIEFGLLLIEIFL